MAILGPTINHHEIRYWAQKHCFQPTELLPGIVDHEPPTIGLVHLNDPALGSRRRPITWDEFFERFNLLGLTFVYDSESGGYNELLQREDCSPYLPPELRNISVEN